MNDIIFPTDLALEHKQKIEDYFGFCPQFLYYHLDCYEDYKKIDNITIKTIIENQPELRGKFYKHNELNYIITISDCNNIFHEVTHAIFYPVLIRLKKETILKDNYLTIFIDEIIAEYHSTRILLKSSKFIIFKANHFKTDCYDLPYLIGAFIALKELNSKITKDVPIWFANIVNIVKENLKFDKTNITFIDCNKLYSIFKTPDT